jgi:DNA-3-methyladenine glycosylase II
MKARGSPGPADLVKGAGERDYLRKADPILARLIDARPDFDPRAWLAELPPMEPFHVLVFQVIGQQLSVIATRSILRRLQDHFGGTLPSPAELLAADPEDLRRVGMSRRKVGTLRALAEQFVDGPLSGGAWQTMSDEDIQACLTSISGIGQWTVQGFLIVALDRQDVVMPGDLVLRKSIQKVYALDHLPSQEEVLQIADAWRPYRSLATSYLFAASVPASVRAAEPGAGRATGEASGASEKE